MKTFRSLSLLLAAAAAQACPCGCVRAPADTLGLRQLQADGQFAFDLRQDTIDQDDRALGAPHHIAAQHRIQTFTLETQQAGVTWGLSVPHVRREMSVVHSGATQTLEGLGDATLSARKSFGDLTVLAGVKLPTGSSDDELLVKRRYLQLGTGSTDALLGLRYGSDIEATGGSWFSQLQGQVAVASDDQFTPGSTVGLTVGYSQPLAGGLSLVLQAAVVRQFRDDNTQSLVDPGYAEDFESSTRVVTLTPGLVWQVGAETTLQAFLSDPRSVRNYARKDDGGVINPIHASRVLSIGLTHRF